VVSFYINANILDKLRKSVIHAHLQIITIYVIVFEQQDNQQLFASYIFTTCS